MNTCYSQENIFYILHNKKIQALEKLSQHKDLISIIVAQAYRINQKGLISGELDPEVIDFCKKNSIHLMAMVTNSNFDDKEAHLFLSNPEAQNSALVKLIELVKKNNLYGIQFDFEMIALKDKNLLSEFYKKAAKLFHDKGYIVSFAVAPVVRDHDFPHFYQKKLYQIWQGAYDLKILNSIADFITVMAYDQHADGTIPGAVASLSWDEEVLQYILKYLPASKISLGIPTYSGLWYMGTSSATKKIYTKYSTLDFETLGYIINKFKPSISWSTNDNVHYTFFDYYGLNKFIFIEDASSFEAKLRLANKYKLRGISVFRIGIEDPKIWNVLSTKNNAAFKLRYLFYSQN